MNDPQAQKRAKQQLDAEEVEVEEPQPPVSVGIGEFLSREIPEREMILGPWLPSQGLAMCYAERGVGKTHVALGVAYAVASGGEFLRWTAPKPRGVLYLDGEMPASAMQERLASLAFNADREPEAPLRIVTPDFQEVRMPDLARPEDQAWLEPLLEDVDLVVVDNLSTLVRSGKENESEGWIPVQEWALRLRAQGKSVLLVHHAGKGGQQRGTSKKEDVLDSVLSLKRPPEYTADQGAVFEVHYEKARGLWGEEANPFEAALSQDGNAQRWAVRSVQEATYERVIRLYEDGLNQTDIANEIGKSKSRVSRHISRAKAEGRITNGGKNGKSA